jgi:hypothetical protein
MFSKYSNLENAISDYQQAQTDENNEEDKEEVDERVNGVVLVPFWAGTAKASGGNSHSEASSEAKHQQAAGTVRYFMFRTCTLPMKRKDVLWYRFF